MPSYVVDVLCGMCGLRYSCGSDLVRSHVLYCGALQLAALSSNKRWLRATRGAVYRLTADTVLSSVGFALFWPRATRLGRMTSEWDLPVNASDHCTTLIQLHKLRAQESWNSLAYCWRSVLVWHLVTLLKTVARYTTDNSLYVVRHTSNIVVSSILSIYHTLSIEREHVTACANDVVVPVAVKYYSLFV